MNNTLEIRLAVLEDQAVLHEIYVHAAQQKQAHDDYTWRDGFTEEGVRWMIDRGTTYAVRVGKEIVGVVALEWGDDGWDDDNENSAGYIRRLAVADGHHGQNIGAKIVDWAAAQVALKERNYLRLDCPEDNQKLCSYYEKLGFKKVAVKRFHDSDTDSLSALYQKEV